MARIVFSHDDFQQAMKDLRWRKEIVEPDVLHRWTCETNPVHGVQLKAVIIREFMKTGGYRWEVTEQGRLIDTDFCATLGRAEQDARSAMRLAMNQLMRYGYITPAPEALL